MTRAPDNLLVELFVEELPPKALRSLGEAFARLLAEGLRGRGLLSEASTATAFASPRRLAVHLAAVAHVARDDEVVTKLMPSSIGFDAEGRPADALQKRLAREGLVHLADEWPNGREGAEQMFLQGEGKAAAVYLRRRVRGATLAVALQGALDEAIAKLPIPKVMQYQLADGWTSVNFVRPAHGLVALHGRDVVPVRVLGLEAGRVTRGHRFEAARPELTLGDADSYPAQLREEGAVIASFEERCAELVRQLEAAAAREGLRPIDDAALLDEVTGLVERPNVMLCRFEEQFLAVPPECLVLTMKANQKYFPLLDEGGGLTNRFLVVSNIRPQDPSRVIEGNERVVRPRLADAKFFFDQDRKKTLASRVPALDKVVYHGKLGSQGDRVRRLRAIAAWVAERIDADVAQADRAAELAKADLLTDMVGEFPELQGVMGGYYAAHDGEPPAVAAAIRGQYVYRRDDQQTADNLIGEALLLADRAETLVGIWGIGLRPSGDKDPYALRRHALAILRSFELIGAGSARASERLVLHELLAFAASTFEGIELQPQTVAEVEAFVYERYANQLGAIFDARAVDAVLGLRPPLPQVVARLKAVREFQRLADAPALAAANKRVGNILRKSEAGAPVEVDAGRLVEADEVALHRAVASVAPVARERFEAADYIGSLQALAALRGPVDAFFDRVMVNAEDPALRANRLALLAGLHAAMNRVADLSKLAL